MGRNHADGDLGSAAVESRPQEFSPLVGDAHGRARSNSVGGNDVRAIDPDVAILQALGAAAGDFHDGE